MTTRLLTTLTLSAIAVLVCACPKETDTPVKKPTAQPGPSSQPTAGTHGGGATSNVTTDRADDAEYIRDGQGIPVRVGIERRFLRQSKTLHTRDPAFVPGTNDLVVVAKVAGVLGLWRMPSDGTRPAELIQPAPMFDRRSPQTARNRSNWFIGTPRVFPDGKNIIFEGSRNSPKEKFANVLGVSPIGGGIVHSVEMNGVDMARTPDVHPDGQHIVFASCTEIRVAKLKDRGDQKLDSTVVTELPRVETSIKGVCTVHRPRYSHDGKRIIFEGVARFLDGELWAKYNVPEPANEADYLIEPWVVNTDGTGLKRLISDEAYAAIGGRIKPGGSKDPEFSPDGNWVVFTHGREIAMVSTDGKKARVLGRAVVEGQSPKVQFQEHDPTFSSDGKKVVSGSQLVSDERIGPPGFAVFDLALIDSSLDTSPPALPQKPLEAPKDDAAP